MHNDGRDTASGLRDTFRTDATVPTIGRERNIIVRGRTWNVQEVIHPITLTPTLVFMSDSIARRVFEYPPNWRVMTEEELYALSWSK